MSNETLLHPPPSTVDEDELVDALHVAPPSRRSLLATRVLGALLLVAVGAVAGIWWQGRDSGTTVGGFPSMAPGGLPSGFPSGMAMPGQQGGTGTGSINGASGTSAGSSGSGASGSSSAPAVVGTVVKVDGDVITVKDLGGTLHEVRTTDATKVTVTDTVAVDDLAAGQTVAVAGTKADDGSVDATSVTTR